MKLKLACRICKGMHTADSKHFPAEIRDKKDNHILGYVCRKCVKKSRKPEKSAKTGKTAAIPL